jgi:flagellar operon protein
MADPRIYLQSQPLIPIGNHNNSAQKTTNTGTQAKASFADIFAKETEKVTFSHHALERMQSRNLQLSEQDLTKLNTAMDRIAQKGAKESLVYLNNIAFVVSVANKTVITAMDGTSAKENIFTNIDSAVIL